MSKPTIVLVPGAWHTPEHYSALLAAFQSRGFPTLSKKLPSVGARNPLDKDTASDAEFIRDNVLLPLLDDGKDVVLLMHSYGGCPGGAAAKGLSKAERLAANKSGGLIGLVFMCAFVANEGDSLRSKLPGNKLDPWILINETTGQLTVDGPQSVFYNGVAEDAIQDAVALLQTHAHQALITPSPPPAWPDKAFDAKRAYIKCHLDRAIPIVGQNAMVEYSGVDWQVLDLEDASHSPFLTHIEPITEFVAKLF